VARSSEKDEEKIRKHKSGFVRTLAIFIGVGIAISLQLTVLTGFKQFQGQNLGLIDYVVTGLIISLGTEGTNQIVKFVKKAKDNQGESAEPKAKVNRP
jgi:cytochrome c biogenesis protein CcdA